MLARPSFHFGFSHTPKHPERIFWGVTKLKWSSLWASQAAWRLIGRYHHSPTTRMRLLEAPWLGVCQSLASIVPNSVVVPVTTLVPQYRTCSPDCPTAMACQDMAVRIVLAVLTPEGNRCLLEQVLKTRAPVTFRRIDTRCAYAAGPVNCMSGQKHPFLDRKDCHG